MTANQVRQYLLSYDIADPKRLQKVHRLLKKEGLPVQYSVFSVVSTKSRLDGLLDRIEQIIDDREDDLRCYGLPGKIECRTLGRQYFPDDILLFSKGVNRLVING
ncbi:CRISPR-associated endonuclease Cas2 [Methylomarinum vadi]|uniref:CRISPR-associated endonuclease Cas2 n=1 Tax=Methylomarinum vadi TaxID=438855 RepID=UPI0004DFC029|nr:CRISPR-associated endonuclease Cas2 [Methylomarinum vadi]